MSPNAVVFSVHRIQPNILPHKPQVYERDMDGKDLNKMEASI